MTILIPMAGEGKRFSQAGYKISKPLIPVDGKPMVIKALDMIPKSKNENIILICRDFHIKSGIDIEISKYYKDVKFITLDYLTQGQACTCLVAENYINNNEELFIGACDNGFIYNLDKYKNLKSKADVIVFTYKGSKKAVKNPEQFGWILSDNQGKINKVSVKKAISDTPEKDSIITGAFWFRQGNFFVQSAKDMIEKNQRINNEFYVDKCIDNAITLGLNVYEFETDEFLCWGTPEELNDYIALHI